MWDDDENIKPTRRGRQAQQDDEEDSENEEDEEGEQQKSELGDSVADLKSKQGSN